MSDSINFSALKARTMDAGSDEAVTVNTRALIDKVLARYSGEWTVLRELLQNAADASATRVKITFETLPSASVPVPQAADPSTTLKHVLAHHTLRRLVINNNGQPFSRTDWDRLKRIAEGNPDETKIGAFGVGFYSVFADCEEPFVSSGKQAMGFFWKGNSLFTRFLELEEAEASGDTNFVLDYRNNTSPVPHLLPLCQFLANSLTFVGIESIELFVDSWNVLSLSKKTAPSESVAISSDIDKKTDEGLMTIHSVARQIAQLDGSWMAAVGWKPKNTTVSSLESITRTETTTSLRSFFSKFAGHTAVEKKVEKPKSEPIPEDITQKSSSTVFLHVHTAEIRTSVPKQFSQELERATKKPPPKSTKLSVLTSPYDAPPSYDSAKTHRDSSLDVFATVLPSKSGRIFIGFPTHQTTGLKAHISAPSVIPTVERESIDLNARYVRTWNVELLRAAGIVCRVAWTAEMSLLKENLDRVVQKAGKTKIRQEEVKQVLPEAIHTVNQFDFRESTPSSKVGELLESAFWTCNKRASISILSTCGVLPSHEVRIAPKDLSFMEGIPTLPEELATGAKAFVQKLIEFGLLVDITVADIKRELENTALTSEQLLEFLRWLSKKSMDKAVDTAALKSLMNVAIANDKNDDGSIAGMLVMSQYKAYLNASKIPLDLPVPPYVVPFKYTKALSREQLHALEWYELQLIPWVQWLVANAGNRNVLPEQNLTASPEFAAQVLPVLSKQWDTLSASSKETLVNLLQDRSVIPTKLGMKKPPQTYFQSVRLFDDLPTVTGLNNVKEKFLGALGVRKTVELELIFERLLNSSQHAENAESKGKSNHVVLIRYLASVQADIPAKDMQRLKSTAFCPAETNQNFAARRFKVAELFQPDQSLRELGLPILEWPTAYRESQVEGKFLTLLGLRKTPTVLELVQTIAKAAKSGDNGLSTRAMGYLLVNYEKNRYSYQEVSRVNLAFLPVQDSSELARPSQCFTDEGATLFGFALLQRDLTPHAQKLGVSQHPPIADCVEVFLRKPPTTNSAARTMYKYFSGRLAELNTTLCVRISAARIIPITSKKGTSEKPVETLLRLVSPKDCYLGDSDMYGDIFDFVDFGHEANSFLLKCGSKHEPTTLEVAHMVIQRPAEILTILRTAEKYLDLLRTLASQSSALKKDKNLIKAMQRTPFLLATKTLPSSQQKQQQHPKLIDFDEDENDDFDDEISRELVLARATDIVLVDDPRSFIQFRENLLAAPQEELLEGFYEILGSKSLSSLIEESVRHGEQSRDQRPAVRLQKQIYERSRLFLHDIAADRIKYDTKWLEKNLKVEVVRSLQIRRSLRGLGISRTENRTAAVIRLRDWTLCVTERSFDMHHVSEALVHFLLHRPPLSSALTLEMLLKTDLPELRNRGYNVDRILRHQAAVARIAEASRKEQLEQEEAAKAAQLAAEQERVRAAGSTNNENAAPQTPQKATANQTKAMPGAFSDSPEGHHEDPRAPDNPLASALNYFRDSTTRGVRDLLQNFNQPQGNQSGYSDMPPPPYSNPGLQSISTGPDSGKSVDISQNLKTAVNASKPHHRPSIVSRGETNEVKESKTYCDDRPAHDLTLVSKTDHGIPFFMDRALPSRSSFVVQNSGGLNAFCVVLKACADIFGLGHDTIHIFYSDGGKTIAFNQGGSLFFNFRYFRDLHLHENNPADAMIYWWTMYCHELSHNLVSDHNSAHGFYTESFIIQYFGKVAQYIAAQGAATAAGPHE